MATTDGTVHAYGSDQVLGLDYIVLELLTGESLAQRIVRAGPLPCDFVRRVGADVADALGAAHEARIVHRDLKPANVFLARRGMRTDAVTVMDFGIAKHFDLDTITKPDQLLGTLPYMAPEQLLDPQCANPRTDIYSLGVMLFECITGMRPFSGLNANELLANILAAEQNDVSRLRPDAPPDIVDCIGRCMRRNAGERYASAQDVWRALTPIPS